jgi:hypothetical protein
LGPLRAPSQPRAARQLLQAFGQKQICVTTEILFLRQNKLCAAPEILLERGLPAKLTARRVS